MVWSGMANAALRLGELGAARHALECLLNVSRAHWPAIDKLCMV
jgi:hypothetical protein